MKIATLFKPDDGIRDHMKEQVEIYGKKITIQLHEKMIVHIL